jgi:putative hydrolase of the HAD superfamily
MRRQPPRALLIDLDGVLRHVAPPADPAVAEAAFAWDLARPAYAGEISHEEWMTLTAAALPLEPDAATEAVTEWQADRGTVDPAVLGLVAEVRAAGIPVGLAANGTDRLPAELTALGLDDVFDVVVNSAAIGIHKPAPRFFEAACAAIGQAPPWVMFVDDDDRAVRAARALNLLAYRWTGPDGVPYLRAALGLS